MKMPVKKNELYLLLMVTLLAIGANLPDQMLGDIIDRKFLLIVLTCIVVISLFRYLRLLLFLCVVALSVGANLPDQLTESLGISPVVMLTFLVLLVLISFMNVMFKMFFTTTSEVHKHDSEESRKAVMTAVAKGDLTKLHWLLSKKVEINFTENGVSPVMLAAEKGYTDIMQLMITHGVDLHVLNADGRTPTEVAQSHGFNRTAEIMKLAEEGTKAGWAE